MSITSRNINKRLHIAVVLVLFAASYLSCGVVCKAQESDAVESRLNEILDDFYTAVPDGMGEFDDAQSVSEALGIKHILETVIGTLRDGSSETLGFLMTLLGVALIGGLASLFDSELALYASRAVGVVSAAMLLDRLAFLLDGARETLGELNSFFAAVAPITLAINSLGASPTTASTQAMGMGITLGAFSFIGERLLGGIVGAVLVTSALSCVDPGLVRLSRGVRRTLVSLLGVITLLLGATFSLQSTISAGADSIAIRGARYAASGAIPIVGGAVSGALGLVAGGVSYARGIVGGGAIAVVLSIVLAPLVTLLVYRLCLGLGVAVCSRCSLDGCEGVLSSFSGALDMLVAVYSLTAVVYIVELIAFLKGGINLA